MHDPFRTAGRYGTLGADVVSEAKNRKDAPLRDGGKGQTRVPRPPKQIKRRSGMVRAGGARRTDAP